ncbi:hypothetical protein [Gorillibacterium sp. sgz500922]|uniref:hypothetical protein n=1 Tax=Gorillibacterium sp. sgz500922 TaxID=3446694 RepID=UPI003F67737C
MTKRMKKSVFGVMALGMTVAGAGGVYAGSNLQKINAYLDNRIDVQVNGTHFVAEDEAGNPLAPITYNNRTYLPVRALSDALNVPIVYNTASRCEAAIAIRIEEGLKPVPSRKTTVKRMGGCNSELTGMRSLLFL